MQGIDRESCSLNTSFINVTLHSGLAQFPVAYTLELIHSGLAQFPVAYKLDIVFSACVYRF